MNPNWNEMKPDQRFREFVNTAEATDIFESEDLAQYVTQEPEDTEDWPGVKFGSKIRLRWSAKAEADPDNLIYLDDDRMVDWNKIPKEEIVEVIGTVLGFRGKNRSRELFIQTAPNCYVCIDDMMGDCGYDYELVEE